MSEVFVARMKERLLSLKEEILRTLAAENEDFENLIQDMDPKDLADIAADDIDRTTLEVLSAQDMRRLNLIESAISRLETGHYGMCMQCGKRIPEKRLEAIPYALLCIDCKSSEERRNR